MRKDFEARSDRAALGIVGAVDKTRYARLDYGPRAHAAGLDGDVHRGVGEPIVAKQVRGFTKNDDFRVGSWIIVSDGAIARAGKNPSAVGKNRADWDFSGGCSGASLFQCFLHKSEIGVHFFERIARGVVELR